MDKVYEIKPDLLPNYAYPSDHLPLYAEFNIKK